MFKNIDRCGQDICVVICLSVPFWDKGYLKIFSCFKIKCVSKNAQFENKQWDLKSCINVKQASTANLELKSC